MKSTLLWGDDGVVKGEYEMYRHSPDATLTSNTFAWHVKRGSENCRQTLQKMPCRSCGSIIGGYYLWRLSEMEYRSQQQLNSTWEE